MLFVIVGTKHEYNNLNNSYDDIIVAGVHMVLASHNGHIAKNDAPEGWCLPCQTL